MAGPSETNTDGASPELSAEDRAAARAFIARCEVRLSTFHRIAVGMLSGAGLLVVLPVVAKDSVTGIMRSLLVESVGVADGLLLIGVGAVLATPIVALWLLFSDLTRFYFHANHLEGDGVERFTARFTLTAPRLASDEFGPAAAAALDAARRDPHMVELLVPANDVSRERIDRQLQVYGSPGEPLDDLGRAEGLFDLAASRSYPLVAEVAKIEHGIARHVLKLRGLVLRYVKALLALLTTALAVYAGDAVVAGAPFDVGLSVSDQVWLAAVVLVWAPLVVVATTSPVRWIEELMRDEGAPATAVGQDPEMTRIERVSLRIAAVGWVTAAVAMVVAISDDAVTSSGRLAGIVVVAASAAAIGIAAMVGRFRSLVTRW